MPPDAAVAESSPAFEFPTDPTARDEFLRSGNLPEAKSAETQPKADSTPAASAEPSGEPAKTAPESAAGNQENGPAAKRLNDLLADLKKAGLTPTELKTFKRQAQEPAKTPETTEAQKPKPQSLEAPTKPQQKDFEDWDKFQEAKDKYQEDYADYRAKLAVWQDRQERAQAEAERELNASLAKANERYGDAAAAVIKDTAKAIWTDEGINPLVKGTLEHSEVLYDVLYVLGSKPEEMQAFIELAKTNPGKAQRKVVVLEQLVEQELKGTAKTEAQEVPERDESGKFKATPKKVTAPPPPEELNTRGSAAADPIEAAFRDSESKGDARSFIDAENRRELARRRGA